MNIRRNTGASLSLRAPRLALPALLGVGALVVSSSAAAGNLTPLKWTKDPIVSPAYIQDGKLKQDAPVLGIRTPKPSGGYTLNPVCRSGDKIYVGTAEYKYSKWRVKCPLDGEAVTNPQYYTTESKSIATQRGRLSSLSVRAFSEPSLYGWTPALLCYGVISGGQRIPGATRPVQRGTLPDKCWVQVMGSSVGLTDWGIFKYKHNPNLPSQNGWWSPGSITTAGSDLPLYMYANPGQYAELCRVTVGPLKFPGQLIRSNGAYRCNATTLNGFSSSTAFDLFSAHLSAGVPKWSGWVTASASEYQLALRISDGSQPWQRVYHCKQYPSGKDGYLRESDGKCKVPGVTSATAETRFKLLRK